MKRDLVTYPHKVLRGPTARVTAWPDRKLVADMWDTMRANNGVGLAAPQIGVGLRVAVVAVDDHELVMANPVLRRKSLDRTVGQEGCLSCPGDMRWVERFKSVTVECLDAEANLVRVEAHGMLAVAIQHELDHLDGKLILDHDDPRAKLVGPDGRPLLDALDDPLRRR